VRFWSTDIDADVAELVDRGIEFEEYDMDAFKTINHIVTSPGIVRSAWFRDPDGNAIALFQPERSRPTSGSAPSPMRASQIALLRRE
jgi:predicted enzyme related to lactoylglutathione lyase